MKTIRIERPSGLDKMRHLLAWQLHYVQGETNRGVVDMLNQPRGVVAMLRDKMLAGQGPTAKSGYAKCTQILEGVQVSVSQRVSQDMELSTVACRYEDIILPAKCMEVIWCDETLPSILVCEGERGGLIFTIDQKKLHERLGDVGHTAWIPRPMLDEALSRRHGFYNSGVRTQWDEDMSDEETEILRYMIVLVLKVPAFAQIPQFLPAKLKTKAELKEAGLLCGAAHRPDRPALSIRYLPRVQRDHAEFNDEPTEKRNFYGRAGHIRHFNSEFFTHCKGTWKYIPPIHPPEGVKIIYRIRKVAATT